MAGETGDPLDGVVSAEILMEGFSLLELMQNCQRLKSAESVIMPVHRDHQGAHFAQFAKGAGDQQENETQVKLTRSWPALADVPGERDADQRAAKKRPSGSLTGGKRSGSPKRKWQNSNAATAARDQ